MRNSSTSCFQNPMPKLRNESRFLLVVGFLTLAPRLFADGGVGRTIGLHPHKEPKLRGFSASLLPRGGKERAMYTNPDVEAPNGTRCSGKGVIRVRADKPKRSHVIPQAPS